MRQFACVIAAQLLWAFTSSVAQITTLLRPSTTRVVTAAAAQLDSASRWARERIADFRIDYILVFEEIIATEIRETTLVSVIDYRRARGGAEAAGGFA